jgi:DNA-binding NarL/FixJ family response regulator
MRKEKTVLIVEDNLDELERISTMLSCEGYDIQSASGISRAQHLLALPDAQFEIIILDLNMSNEFLCDALKPKTEFGSLTGWVWFYYVARAMLGFDFRLVIYSAFVEELYGKIKTLPTDHDERRYFETMQIAGKISLVSKSAAVNDAGILSRELSKLIQGGTGCHV